MLGSDCNRWKKRQDWADRDKLRTSSFFIGFSEEAEEKSSRGPYSLCDFYCRTNPAARRSLQRPQFA
jgi:hypothetical protein